MKQATVPAAMVCQSEPSDLPRMNPAQRDGFRGWDPDIVHEHDDEYEHVSVMEEEGKSECSQRSIIRGFPVDQTGRSGSMG